jgi:hypothetical protein
MPISVVVRDQKVVVTTGGPPGPEGPQGPAGNAAGGTYTATETISALRVVKSTGSGTVAICQPTDDEPAFGLATTAASNSGDDVTVVQLGEVEDASWSWTMGRSVFLGPNGALTQDIAGLTKLTVIGKPSATNRLLVRIQPTITLA